jgi:hypothetical protein
LLKFLENLGLTISDFKYINIDGKVRNVGVLVEEINLIFIGKIYKSGNIERWQGYDAVTGAFKKAKHFSEFLQENLNNYSFVVEGAGITQTNRLRPKFLTEIGFDSIYLQYYNYPAEGKEEYYKRIIYRSGEKPKKDVMWDKNLGFIRDAEWSEKEITQINTNKVNVMLDVKEFDEPIDDFGCKLLYFTQNSKQIEGFQKFVKELDYINTNKFENFGK